ncbi:MAG: hypothetical protein WED33_10710 [Bacteroidia bacterium]
MISSILHNRFSFIKKSGFLILALGILLSASSCKKEDLDPLEYPTTSLEIKEIVLRLDNIYWQSNRIFWTETLGFELISQTALSYTIQVGDSRLTFRPKNTTNSPTYSFSISIPQNQVENALAWLKNENGEFADGPTQPITIIRDELTGAEIINKPLYNANSVFFRDAAGNVIELIARNDIENSVEGPFNRSQFLKISEAPVVTKQVRDCEEILDSEFGAKAFPRTTSGYRPVGGAEGVLLLIIPGRPWIPTETDLATQYDIEIIVKHPEEKEFLLPSSMATIRTEP